MAYRKVVIEQSDKLSSKKFKIKKQKDSEEDIFIEFDNDVDYVIEKLSLDGLPAEVDAKNPIVWLNNFSVKDAKGNYVNGVTYYVTMPAVEGYKRIVYFDGTSVVVYTDTVQDVTENNKPMKKFKLKVGDPAAGWTT